MPLTPFSSPQVFQQSFIDGLRQLIGNENLGELVLVLANASFDPKVMEALAQPLSVWFHELDQRVRDELHEGRPPDEPPDDLMVFLKLMAIEFENIRKTEIRQLGRWEVQFNHVRAFRPRRLTTKAASGMSAPFDPEGFHFDKAFLRKETFWSGDLFGRDVDLLYNKFPFVTSHALLVPNRTQHLPQYLTESYHHYIWEVVQRLGDNLPGVGFGYNSYGAYASVNHLHFQMFVREQPLPVAHRLWKHNGGEQDYPSECYRFTSVREAWSCLNQFHQEEISYNLVYMPGLVYCLPRKKQGGYQHSDWTGGFAWYEMAGGYTTFNKQDFDVLTAETIELEFAAVTRN